MGKMRDALNKPISTAGHYTGMATAAAGMLATGNAGMGLVGYGLGYGLTAIGKAYKESPHAGGRHSATSDAQFKDYNK
jgi:hypothetical protein